MTTWTFLGKGSYNTAYLSDDGKEVLKIRHNANDETDSPERSVRLWNMINSHIHPPARLEINDLGVGWVCPFIEGVQASDQEMANALIDIYNKTGRIVVDAPATKNFIKTATGQIVCVDIGLAVQLEQREANIFSATPQERRKSTISTTSWHQRQLFHHADFMRRLGNKAPMTIDMIKALLFVQSQRPDLQDVSFLKHNPTMIKSLVSAYDMQQKGRFFALVDINPDLVIFPIPKLKADDEMRNFRKYLEVHHPSLLFWVSADIIVRDIPNHDLGQYVHVEISNLRMQDAFVGYLSEQRQKLVDQEIAVDKLITYFNDKITAIDVILKNINNDKTLSWTEQRLLTRFCNGLKSDIQQQLFEVKLDEPIDKTYYKIHDFIEEKMNDMIKSSASISIRSGFRGFVNDVCEACGLGRPFAIVHGETEVAVILMKSVVQDLKASELEKLKEKKPADEANQVVENNSRLT